MEVILKEDVTKLGHRGDVVKVADGYGRNYLLPGKLAIEATAANKAVIEQMKGSAIRKLAKEKIESEELAKKLEAKDAEIAQLNTKLAALGEVSAQGLPAPSNGSRGFLGRAWHTLF